MWFPFILTSLRHKNLRVSPSPSIQAIISPWKSQCRCAICVLSAYCYSYACSWPAVPNLSAENLALRQQLAILKQKSIRSRLRNRDRIFWVSLSRFWTPWRGALHIVQPETVVRWHKQGFKLYWRWKSRPGEVGRPKIDAEIRKMIRQMSRENPLWGTPRIQSELRLLGYEVSQPTIDKYKYRHHNPPSQTWRTFLDNHVGDIVAIDFFTVPTATFRVLYCFIMLRHDRRKVAHFNVTAHPTAQWTAQQIVEAFPL